MKNPTITVFTANYYPEDTAIGLYTSQFTRFLTDHGYSVNVVTAFPYYPQWKIWKSYSTYPDYYTEVIDGCTVYRHRQFMPEKVNFSGRVRLMLSFIKGAMANKNKIAETDLVFCIVPFTLSIYPASRLAKKHGAPLWIHIQDLEFDLASETGLLKNGLVASGFKKALRFTERYLLNKASIVSSISHSMINKIRNKCNVKSLAYFPNWVSEGFIDPQNYTHHEYISPHKFTLLYSGNIGEKQDWDFFLKLCACVNDPDIEIVVVGDGGYSDTLRLKAAAYKFVKFYPLVEFSNLSNLLCSANVHFLFQKADVMDSIMPSKLLGMMASARPSIVTGNRNSEVAVVFERSNAGYFFDSATAAPQTVYEALIALKADTAQAAQMGALARHYVIDHFSQEKVLKTTLDKIHALIDKK